LPAPREHGPQGGPGDMGDPVATMKIWKQLNKAKNEVEAKIADSESKLDKIPALDPRVPRSFQNTRNKKVSKLFKQISKDYADHASKLKTLKSENADTELIKMVVSEANLADKLSTIYKSLADEILLQSGFREMESGNVAIKEQLADIRSKHDVLRINLSRKYDTQFPTLEDTAKETEAAGEGGDAKKTEGVVSDKTKPVDARLSVLRTWTDSTGTHKIKAKYRGMEDGKVKLEKSDGSTVLVPPDSLSDTDRRFIGVD
jgi:hypothetical protein